MTRAIEYEQATLSVKTAGDAVGAPPAAIPIHIALPYFFGREAKEG